MIFLYKLTKGTMNKSFGLNVAELAGIPKEVLLKANEKSENFEKIYKQKIIEKTFKEGINLIKSEEKEDAEQIFSKLENLIEIIS